MAENIDQDLLTRIVDQTAALVDIAGDRAVLVGLDGAVAAGKSTLAAELARALAAAGLPTAIVAADGFLLGADALRARRLTARKGFPESFDRPAMRAFLEALRRGETPSAPLYSHADYDVSADGRRDSQGAVVIFEGVNVLGADLTALYDLRIYLDVTEDEARRRFLRRFAATPFTPVRSNALAPWRPADGDPRAWGGAVWAAINAPNLRDHIAAGRARADVVVAGKSRPD